jgi:hypothetical protein
MAFMFGRGQKASSSARGYSGPGIRFDPSTLNDSVSTSTSSSTSLYAERLKNKFNLGVPGRASATAASDAASDYVPRAESPARRGSRMAGETSSGARQALGPAPLGNRPSVSRSMDDTTLRRILSARGQLRGLEGRGTVPEPGSRSTGRTPKTNLGRRPVSTGPGIGTAKAGYNAAFAAAIQHTRDADAFNARTGAGTPRGRAPRPLVSANPNAGIGNLKAGHNALFGEAIQHARDTDAFNRRTGAGTPRGRAPRGPMGPDASGGGLPGRADAPRNPRGSGGIMRGLRNMSSRNKLMMGGGALVLGAAAYSGRRGDGTSSGRSGMTRY